MGVRGRARGVAGLTALTVLVAAGCINFEPAVPVQASRVEAARSVDAVFADVTGDGADDVVAAVTLPDAETDTIVRMTPCGDGCLDRREEIPVGDTVHDLDVADVDGDGVDDVVVVTTGADLLTDGEVLVFFGGPAATGRPEGLVADDSVVAAADPFFQPWSQVVAGDLDGDGDVDLGLAARQIYEYVAGDGEGGFAAPVNVALLPSRASVNGIAAGDVTGDGQQDVVVSIAGLGIGTTVGQVGVYENGTEDAFGHEETGRLFGDVVAGDIDGDGIEDVAVTSQAGLGMDRNVRLLRSTGTALTGFGAGGAVTSVAEDGSGPVLRDLDLDGHVDLLATIGTDLRWWHGNGSGAFVVPVRRAAGPLPHNLELSNRSGAPGPDLLVTNSTAPFAQISYLANASQLPD